MALDPDDNRPMPVMTPQQITSLPLGHALVLRNGLRPVIGRAPWIGRRATPRLWWWLTDTATAGRRVLGGAARDLADATGRRVRPVPGVVTVEDVLAAEHGDGRPHPNPDDRRDDDRRDDETGGSA